MKTDVGQVDLVSRLSDGTSENMTVLPFEGYFIIKMCCFVIFTDFNFVNNYINVCTLSLITTVNQEIF